MQISYRQIPHPVLSYFSDDVINSDFQASLKSSKTQNSYLFEAECACSCEGINNFINQQKAHYAFHFECPTTRYRRMFTSYNSNFSFQVPSDYLDGKVQVCSFIIASVDIEKYQLSDFHPDYEETAFYIKKGDVLAIDVERNFFADKEVDPLKKIPSIFSIQPNRSEDAVPIDFDASGNKIIVKLSETNFNNYKMLSMDQNLQHILSSMIIMPVLVSILESIKYSNELIDYEECRWYQVLYSRLKELSIDTNVEGSFNDSSIVIAEKLIGDPLSISLLALVNFEDES